MQPQFERLDNLRDLGGMRTADGRTVRHGRLYRSQQLCEANEADLAALEKLNLSLILDMRDPFEREERPNPALPGARDVSLPVLDFLGVGVTRGSKGDERIVASLKSGVTTIEQVDAQISVLYRSFISNDYARSQYARFVDEIIAAGERDEAVLWHCTGGKDRAGFATIILLTALGVEQSAILEDYLLTNVRMKNAIDRLCESMQHLFPVEVPYEVIRHYFVADKAYVDAAFDEANKQFGSFDAYLEQGLGLDASKCEHLQELYLE